MEEARQFILNLALLKPGAVVTLDMSTPAGQRGKFRSIFVGYLPKHYVLVQFPDSSKLGSFAQYITQGMGVTVRGLIEGHEGAVVGFVSNVKQTIQIPSRLIVLEFPREVSLQKLRASTRISTHIKVQIKAEEECWSAIISDISVSGCQLLVSNGEQVKLSAGKALEIIIEDSKGLTDVKLSAEICNNKVLAEGVSLGVKFDDSSKNEVKTLMQEAVIARH